MDTIQIWEYQIEDPAGPGLLTMTLNKPGREIVEALGVFHYLTAEQLSRYLGRSLRYIQLHTQRLTQERFIQALVPSKQIRFGGVPYVYTLGRRGRAYLIREGIPVKKRYRPSEEEKRQGRPLLHTLAVNEVLLLSHLLTRMQPTVELAGFVTEREFLHDPLKVTLPQEKHQVSLSPDLWLDFQQGKTHDKLCVEVNLTPVEQRRWRQKVRSYLYGLPAYKERFQTEALLIAVIVVSPIDFPRRRSGTPSSPEERRQEAKDAKRRQKRLQDLLHWTEAELVSLNALEAAAGLFCLGEVSTSTLTPLSLFRKPRFLVPGHQVPIALVPPEDTNDTGEVAGA